MGMQRCENVTLQGTITQTGSVEIYMAKIVLRNDTFSSLGHRCTFQGCGEVLVFDGNCKKKLIGGMCVLQQKQDLLSAPA